MKNGKRIDMTDVELATAMWVYIYLFIESYDGSAEEAPHITTLKEHFLLEHGCERVWRGDVKWRSSCLLCQRYLYAEGGTDDTCACPLSEGGLSCGRGSAWNRVNNYIKEREIALACAKYILKIVAREED